MKKLLSISLLLVISLTSCGGKSDVKTETGKLLKTSDFELYYPKNWSEISGEIDFATVYSIDSLKLITFSRAPGEGMGKTVLSFEETYKKFEADYIRGAISEIEHVETENGIDMEIIKFKNIDDAFIFDLSSSEGTLALWNNGQTSYALIDQSNMHQADGEFESIYESFKHLN